MKRLLTIIFCIILYTNAYSQYLMNNTNVTLTCSGTETFYDSGGSGGQYSSNENYTKTFCAAVGQIISFNFTAFRTNDVGDVLYIYDGPTTLSPLIGTRSLNLGGFGTINSSGNCLTFKFVSNGAGTRAGWIASITCTTMSPCNYMFTMIDAGCNGTGLSFYGIYFNGALAGYVYPDPYCRLNILLTGFIVGDWILINYSYDGNSAIDTQNSFELRDGYGNIVAAGFIPTGTSGTTTSIASVTTTCVAPPGESSYVEDCAWTQTLCSNNSFNGNSSGTGNVFELNLTNSGCLFGEHQSSWYYFTAQTSGILGLTISPSNGTDDYDFAIWNASTCPPNAPPIRCSWAAINGNTGLGNSAVDNSESFDGDGWASTINVTAGQSFLLLVDNWSSTSSPYSVTWSLGGGASLDCTPLPVELSDFYGYCDNGINSLTWITASETNISSFKLYRVDFIFQNTSLVGTIASHGALIPYFLNDNYSNGEMTTYYFLKEVDFDGNENIVSQIIPLENCELTLSDIYIWPNPVQNNGDIHIIGNVSEINIYDITGREVPFKLKADNTIGELSSGLYVIIVNGINTFKLIVN